MSKVIKFQVKLNVDGKEQLVTATTNARDFKKGLDIAQTSAAKLQNVMVKFASIATIVKDVGGALGELSAKLNEFQHKNLALQQQTGLTGAAMSKLRNEVQAVADTYGKDFNEVLNGTSRLMKGFGLSSEEAMRLVRDGLMSGADATGQMFDILGEYPAYFREAGMSAEQFMAVITQGAQMGVFNDKAADTIKEGNLRLREMTSATSDALNGIGLDSEKIQQQLRSGLTTTFEVMQQVGARLKELPQTSAEVGTAIADIFGGPGEDAGLAYIESLADMQLSMDALKGSASEMGVAMDGQVEKMSMLNSVLTGVVDEFNVMPSLQPFINITAQLGMTVTGVAALATGLKGLNVAQMATKAKSALVSAGNVLMGTTARGAAVGVSALSMALRSALIITAVVTAAAALAQAFKVLSERANEARESQERMKRIEEQLAQLHEDEKASQDNLAQSYANIRGEMTSTIATLKNFHGSKEEEKKLVGEMNSKYGESMGYYSSVNQWYNALVKNSESYCQQMVREIQIRDLANKAAKQKAEVDEIVGGLDKLSTKRKRNKVNAAVGGGGMTGAVMVDGEEIVGSSDQEKARAKATQLYDDYLATLRKMNELAKENANTSYSKLPGALASAPDMGGKGGSKSGGSASTKASKAAAVGSIDWYEEMISGLNKQISATSDVGEAQSLMGRKAMFEAGLKNLKVKIGLEVDESEGDGNVLSRLEEINSICETLGIDPIPIEFDTKGVDKAKEKFNTAADAVAQMGSSLSGLGGALEMPELDIAGTIAQAVANVAMGYSSATTQAASMGPWAWIAFAATGLAQMVAIISTIKNATGFATGGVVGGNSRSGDRLIARVNSGEMILNSAQQRRLFDIVNGVNIGAASVPNVSAVSVGSLAGAAEQTFNVEFTEPRWSGTSMMLGIKNVQRVMAKSGRYV